MIKITKKIMVFYICLIVVFCINGCKDSSIESENSVATTNINIENENKTTIETTESNTQNNTDETESMIQKETETEKETTLPERTIGASLPEIIFVNESSVILYDSENVYFYDIEKEKVTDIWDKGELGFNFTEGDYASAVKLSEDQRKVYAFYLDTPNQGYAYDIESKEVTEVSDIEDDSWKCSVLGEEDDIYEGLLSSELNQIGDVVISNNNQYSLLIPNDTISYGDICLGISDGTGLKTVKIFN